MNNPIPNITDEVGEQLKDMGRIAKKQIVGDKPQKPQEEDLGKKPPTKQQLNDLKQQMAQLRMTKLKKVREELEKQRLKVTEAKKLGQIQTGDKAPKDDAVAKTLKASKSTGEFKGLIGG